MDEKPGLPGAARRLKTLKKTEVRHFFVHAAKIRFYF
jgi:hypothetical protein